MKRIYKLLLILIMVFTLAGCAAALPEDITNTVAETNAATEAEIASTFATEETTLEDTLDEDGWYYSRDEVALYIYTYDHLPDNFMTKKEARELGWDGGSLEEFAPGMVIGGDSFGNREGILPAEKGRKYTECDIDTNGAEKRGAKRIVFSNDGLIYYTEDHYETFTLLYGEE